MLKKKIDTVIHTAPVWSIEGIWEAERTGEIHEILFWDYFHVWDFTQHNAEHMELCEINYRGPIIERDVDDILDRWHMLGANMDYVDLSKGWLDEEILTQYMGSETMHLHEMYFSYREDLVDKPEGIIVDVYLHGCPDGQKGYALEFTQGMYLCDRCGKFIKA